MPKPRICVIGFPSILGGADTELLQQSKIWLKMGVEVHFIHHSQYSPTATVIIDDVKSLGAIVHEAKDFSKIDGMPCISYCAGPALAQIEEIRKYTETFIFVNCMTWLFPKEKEHITSGAITHNLYQRQQVLDKHKKELMALNSSLSMDLVKPYFDTAPFPMIDRSGKEYNKTFKFGRIHRADAGKFHPDTLGIYNTMVAPVLKEGKILGMKPDIAKKIGTPPTWITAYKENGIPQSEFYKFAKAIIQPCDPGHTENLPRISFEAMSSGSLLVVDDKGGFQDQVIHGETGWLCKDHREFIYYGSRVAYEHDETARMAANARQYLEDNWGETATIKGWTSYFEKIGVL